MRKWIRVPALLVLAGLCAWLFWLRPAGPAEPDPDPSLPPILSAPEGTPSREPVPALVPDPDYVPPAPEAEPKPEAEGQLIVTDERRAYADRDLILVIPKLGLNAPIYGGTEPATLNKGVCLFDYAQLPGEGDRNVSLAAHRNGRRNGVVTDDQPFYYIDTLGEGDYLYLHDGEKIYRYLYLDTIIIEDLTDWSLIKTQGKSVITLMSCEPIGSTEKRLFVRGALDEIVDFAADYVYAERADG